MAPKEEQQDEQIDEQYALEVACLPYATSGERNQAGSAPATGIFTVVAEPGRLTDTGTYRNIPERLIRRSRQARLLHDQTQRDFPDFFRVP